MSRLLIVLCVVATLNVGHVQGQVAPQPQAQSKVRAALATPIQLRNGIDSNTPLKDALEYLSARSKDVLIVINTQGFEAIGVQKVEETAVQLQGMPRSLPMATVLQLLLRQVRGEDAHGTFLVREDHIEVTTTRHVDPQAWIKQRNFAPIVAADFERVDLQEALKKLADQTGISIVFDRRQETVPVTIRLRNIRLDTAVMLLADIADLQAVPMENVLYVTSKDNAKAIVAEQERAVAAAEARRKARLEQLQSEANPFVVPPK